MALLRMMGGRFIVGCTPVCLLVCVVRLADCLGIKMGTLTFLLSSVPDYGRDRTRTCEPHGCEPCAETALIWVQTTIIHLCPCEL